MTTTNTIILHEIAGKIRAFSFGPKCFETFYEKTGLTPENAVSFAKEYKGLGIAAILILTAYNAAAEQEVRQPIDEQEVQNWMQADIMGVMALFLSALSNSVRFQQHLMNTN